MIETANSSASPAAAGLFATTLKAAGVKASGAELLKTSSASTSLPESAHAP
ncbi:MAG TPA: hypothetical protein VGY54_02805 [Polyangiaceae bacterium]|nr:hypothetical protein [Polyangiaceae bacterium]